jgi:hypothetical protein
MDSALLTGLQQAGSLGLSALQQGGFLPAWLRFRLAAMNPERAQLARLRALVRGNAGSEFGQAHGFASIDSVADFRRSVPQRDFDDFAPWIERVAQGRAGVLTSAPVRMLERSGGSTAPNKLIPYTDELLGDYSAATHAWIFDLFQHCPQLWGTRSYWSISPACRQVERTAGGIPIGFEDDTEYFGPIRRWALRQVMAVPNEVARLPSMDQWREATCRHLLEADDLGLISVWSPTFLSLLMDYIQQNLAHLLGGVSPGRAAAILRALDRGGETALGRALWPRLAVISCWTDGASRAFVPQVQRWFPGVQLQSKGLLATEGVVSFPLWGRRGTALAVTSHFMEFIDVEQPQGEPLLAHQLRSGGRYSPLLTTGGGLYRYHLKDVVRCVGRVNHLPLVRFDGKLDCVSDLCGEKLNAGQVEEGLRRAAEATGVEFRFALLSPTSRPRPGYCLYVESDASTPKLRHAVALLEDYLLSGHHYRYCNQLGQLEPLHMVRVVRGWESYQAAWVRLGRRLGDLKPSPLDVLGLGQEVAWESEAQAA